MSTELSEQAAAVRVLIMAGGTGGHVFPALALARELMRRDCRVEWLGTAQGIEARLVPGAGIAFHTIVVRGLRGKKLASLLQAPWVVGSAVIAAGQILRRLRPHLVIGLGGYASGPGGVAAKLLGIPLVIHEQNARAGTTNQYLARLAKRVLSGLPSNLPRCQAIGNPVREDILAVPPPEERDFESDRALHLLVLGGSLGARAINECVPEAIAMIGSNRRPVVLHQCGERHVVAAEQRYRQLSVAGRIEAFIDDVAGALAWADLVVCRAGALTVSELAAAGVAAILIPFPHAIDDHQTANGQWLVEHGAAELHQQKNLSAAQLAERIEYFIEHRQALKNMALAARQLAKPKAAQQFADICMEVAHG